MHPIKYPANSNVHEIARKANEVSSLQQSVKEYYARKLQEAFDNNDEVIIKQVCAVLNQHTPKLVAIATKTQTKTQAKKG